MKIIDWAVEKAVSVIMLMVFILILGFVSLTRLSIDLLPRIEVPVAVVNTSFPSAGPYEIENIITRPIESALAMVHNVKGITSNSSEGNSSVIVEFNEGTNMDFATLEMREKIDLIKNYLPDDISTPVVLKIDPNALPIMQVGITGNHSLLELQRITENYIKPRLERLTGVAAVDISGGREEIIEIQVNPVILNNLAIPLQQLISLIKAENINMPIGEVRDGNSTRLIRGIGEFETVEDIKNLPIPSPLGTVVLLSDIARVQLITAKPTELARINGKESIRVTIQKQPGSNTVRVANLVHNELKHLSSHMAGVNIEIIIDQSDYIKKAIANVGRTAIFGGLLAIIVLYLFLRDEKSTLIIALAIPISVMATFALMYFFNITLNLLSLGGFALGVGMLVDNGIVVTENIHRYREMEGDNKAFAVKGAKEVAMPVIASTMTTLAVFLPIVFVEGMTAQIFRELALTVTFAMLASLLVSLTLVPMLSSKILKNRKHKDKENNNRLTKPLSRLVLIMKAYHQRILKYSLKHRAIAILITIGIFLASIASLFLVGAEYFPQLDEGTFTIDIRLPQEATLEDTKAVVHRAEEVLGRIDEVDTIFSNIGGRDTFFILSQARANRASIDARLVPISIRKESTGEIMDRVRQKLKTIPGAEIKVSASSSLMFMGFGGFPVEIEISGNNMETLRVISNDFIEMVKGVPGIREVSSTYVEDKPQLALVVNRDIAARHGVQTLQVTSFVNQLVRGINVTNLMESRGEVNVIVRGMDYMTDSIENFMQIPIMTPLGITIPLQQLAELEVVKGPTVIRRRDQARVVSINAAIFQRDLNSVINDINKRLDNYSMPAGYSFRFRGERQQLMEAISSLILVVILAIVLVYMILASQFQSFIHPLTIMLAVPLAFSGGALGLLFTGRSVSVPALIGAVVLAGIVVNNGIVLIDYINVLRNDGLDRNEALIQAGETRLRPIMMTTFTTVLGLLPLAIGLGEGGEAQAPMATVVIGGLILATLLTLVVIPVIYSLFDDLQDRIIKQ